MESVSSTNSLERGGSIVKISTSFIGMNGEGFDDTD